MTPSKIAAIFAAAVLVAGVLFLVWVQMPQTAARSERLQCAATSYLAPDIVTANISLVTVTSGNVTTVSTILGSPIDPGTTALGSTVYSTFTDASEPVGYVTTSSSYNPDIVPSSEWTLVTCTYEP